VRTGSGSVCILAVGKMLTAAAEAAETLAAEGIDVTLWDVRVVSDPDPAMLADASRHDVVLTVEDGVRQGGAGMFLAEALRASCPQGTAPPVLSLGIPRAYIAQDKPDRILARMGLDATGIAGSVREAVGASSRPAAGARRVRTTSPVVPPRPATLTAQDAPD
jgi:1-deoxy-D-xylulose-5-phosphate synthase